jgi:hypothetical protein
MGKVVAEKERGWEIEWENGVSTVFPGDGDEISNLAPEDGVGSCDFCTSEDPRWEHRCGDSRRVLVAIKASGVEAAGSGMHGSWAACEVCHRLIEAGKRDALANRTARQLARKSRAPFNLVLLTVKQTHAQYWEHRVGPGFPIRQRQSGATG